MHFRNGAVAFFYVSTLLLRLVDQQVVSLDDPLASWLPDLPDADQVTLRMLANMTAGYPDYVQNPKLSQELYADPFRQWTPEEQIAIGLSTPRVFAPGTNWDYSHTDYVILGQALEKITGQPLDVALQEQVLGPMGLRNTVAWSTPEIYGAGPACLQLGAAASAGHPRRHAILRGVDLLEPVLDVCPGRHPDD